MSLEATEPGPRGPGRFAFSRHVLAVREWWGGHAIAQLLIFSSVVAVFWIGGANTLQSMQRLGIEPGFEFLSRTASFAIGDSLISYSAGDTYGRAILVGLLNTIQISIVGCFLATLLGTALGVARFSGNPLLVWLVQAYVELMRNTPLLLQLFFWNAVAHAFPPPREALSLLDTFFLSNRGVFVPSFALQNVSPLVWLAIAGAVTAALLYVVVGMRQQNRLSSARIGFGMAGVAATAIVAMLMGGADLSLQVPSLKGFNMIGGLTLSPEFAALLTGLTINAAATISEIVRSGIQSIGNGQWEAGRALGLPKRRIMRLIILPQAMRVITPLMTSSYLDLTKNSSLAVAIGFPDLVSVINTTANQTGQAFETIVILVGTYLTINLSISTLINRYNKRILARESRG